MCCILNGGNLSGDGISDSYGQPDYWWLRSPRTAYTGGAYFVGSGGGVDGYLNSVYGVDNSYGKIRSPYIVYNNNYECHVNSDGDGNAARVYYYSYGNFLSDYWWLMDDMDYK